jgi:hypothetical protein
VYYPTIKKRAYDKIQAMEMIHRFFISSYPPAIGDCVAGQVLLFAHSATSL